jgi:hypothetical protein
MNKQCYRKDNINANIMVLILQIITDKRCSV